MSEPVTRGAAPAQTSSPAQSPWDKFMPWLREEAITAPLVPVLHPTPLRVKGLGLFTLVGHPLFWWVWSHLVPQQYEHLGLRLFTGCAFREYP